MTSRSRAAFCFPKSRIAWSTSAGSLTDIALPASVASAGTQEWRTTARWNRLCLRSSDWTGLGLGVAKAESADENAVFPILIISRQVGRMRLGDFITGHTGKLFASKAIR